MSESNMDRWRAICRKTPDLKKQLDVAYPDCGPSGDSDVYVSPRDPSYPAFSNGSKPLWRIVVYGRYIYDGQRPYVNARLNKDGTFTWDRAKLQKHLEAMRTKVEAEKQRMHGIRAAKADMPTNIPDWLRVAVDHDAPGLYVVSIKRSLTRQKLLELLSAVRPLAF